MKVGVTQTSQSLTDQNLCALIFGIGHTKQMVSTQLTVSRISVSSAAKVLRTHIHMHSPRRESTPKGLKQLIEDITSAVRPTPPRDTDKLGQHHVVK